MSVVISLTQMLFSSELSKEAWISKMATITESYSFLGDYWTPNNLFYSVFIFSWIVFVWDMYVVCRQVSFM